MNREPVIEVDHLTRRFGRLVAVDDVTFGVGEGEVLGFLGPNGAGKSTTLRVLMGFLHPTAGSCRVLGVWPGTDVDVRRRIGYLPGDFRIDPRMRPSELFEWFAAVRGVPGKPAHQLAERSGTRSLAALPDAVEGESSEGRPGAGVPP